MQLCPRTGLPRTGGTAPLRTLPQETAAAGGVPLEPLSRAQVAELEPELRCEGALLSHTTGIIDSHRQGGS